MSCGEQRTLSGAAIGAGTDAAVGSLAKSRPLAGAALGAAAGAVGGYLFDRHDSVAKIITAMKRKLRKYGG